jgi:YD repeat-containing protein
MDASGNRTVYSYDNESETSDSQHLTQEDEPSKRIEELIWQLGSDDVSIREKASQALLKIGKPAEIALRKAAESQDPEVKSRAKTILEKNKVLRVDEQGRVLAERDDKGWNVEYTRDDRGNAIKKAWVNPHDGKVTYVRLYTYEVATGRIVEEVDPGGRKRLSQYDRNGNVEKMLGPEGFLEEADQVAAMPSPSKKSPGVAAPNDEGDKKSDSKEK